MAPGRTEAARLIGTQSVAAERFQLLVPSRSHSRAGATSQALIDVVCVDPQFLQRCGALASFLAFVVHRLPHRLHRALTRYLDMEDPLPYNSQNLLIKIMSIFQITITEQYN